MSSVYGKKIKISIFGQSHSPAIGVNIDGLPAGIKLDMDELRVFMKRRSPGKDDISTSRTEADEPEIICGIVNGVTCGAPLTVVIRNTDARSSDYSQLRDTPRPSHSDYAAHVKFNGNHDISGGGHFSGRLTAPLCAAGGICLQILKSSGINICAHILQTGDAKDDSFDMAGVSLKDFMAISENPLPVLRREAGEKMKQEILNAKEKGDSIGGIIECAAVGIPAGIGDPMFDGIENRIAQIVFGIPAVKGIEFGNGFAAAGNFGSKNNDPFFVDEGKIKTRTNNSGGITGGITNGMPVIFRAAFKPTPSIGIQQESVSLSRLENTVLKINGRHDPCIIVRAVPCVEAAAAIALYDAYLDR
ncbi:MAG: chorismate synthase [Treponema sp.]|nr:chorismate synthase [Treponema sp.]MCL2271869.1 chorismate synthase [Treponema sp.]